MRDGITAGAAESQTHRLLPVDLVINCYERTYRTVLAPGFFPAILTQNRIRAAGVHAVINNVEDRPDATALAQRLVDAGEIDDFCFVSDRLPAALALTGLTVANLRERPYFVDYALVMMTVGEQPFILGWDAEVALDSPMDWTAPGIELLRRRPDIASVTPRWPAGDHDTLDDETIAIDGPWHLTWSFSDQIWLVRRSEFAGPIYRHFALATLARPHHHHFYSFESRVESYLRVSRRYRAVHSEARYGHPWHGSVITRLGGPTLRERARVLPSRLVLFCLLRLKLRRPTLRVP